MQWSRLGWVMSRALLVLLLLPPNSAVASGTAGVPVKSAAWTIDYPAGPTADLYGIAYGNGIWVAVGSDGVIVSSSDLKSWHEHNRKHSLYAITFGAGQFVAVGERALIMTSTNGTEWFVRNLQDNQLSTTFQAVAFGDGRWVVAGGEQVLTSLDAIHWQPTLMKNITAVTFGSQGFVAVGEDGVFRSPDGVKWTQQLDTPARDVAYFKGRYFVLRDKAQLLVSEDGTAWDSVRGVQPTGLLNSLVVGNGRIYVYRFDRAYISADGLTWSESKANIRGHRFGSVNGRLVQPGGRNLAYADGKFVEVGDSGYVATSDNGTDWTTTYAKPERAIIFKVVKANGLHVAVGGDAIYTSADGRSWSTVARWSPSVPFLYDLTYANGQFVAVGYGAVTSTDGTHWTVRANWEGHIDKMWADGSPPLHGVLYFNGRYVAVGDGGTVATSTDGVTWSKAVLPGHRDLNALAYGSGRLVALGNGCVTSVDGLGWNECVLPTGPNPAYDAAFGRVTSLVYAAGRFVAVGRMAEVLQSVDGVHWTNEVMPLDVFLYRLGALPPDLSLRSVSYTHGHFVAVGDWGMAFVSKDGHDWVPVNYGGSENLTLVTEVDGQVVAYSPYTMMTSNGGWCSELFADVGLHNPACQAVELLASRSVISGYGGLFHPEAAVTRAELAKMIDLTFGWMPDSNGGLPFTDVQGHWASQQGYLQPLVTHHVMDGFPDGTFAPDGAVTRAQFAKIVASAAGLREASTKPYSDIDPEAWFAGWMGSAYDAGFIGVNAPFEVWVGPTVHSEVPVRRFEAALVLANVLAVRGRPSGP